MRGKFRGLVVFAVAALLPLAVSSGVRAQVYPGPSPSTTAGPTADETFAGTFIQGNTFTNEACGFRAGTSTEVTFNGQGAGNDDVDSDGCVRHVVNITDVDSTNNSGGALGRPTLAVTGMFHWFAAVRSVTVEILGKKFPGKGDGTDSIVVSGTGANGQPRTFTTRFKASDQKTQVLGSTLDRLTRTGADLAPIAIAGAALFGFGFLLTRVRRRGRVASPATE